MLFLIKLWQIDDVQEVGYFIWDAVKNNINDLVSKPNTAECTRI